MKDKGNLEAPTWYDWGIGVATADSNPSLGEAGSYSQAQPSGYRCGSGQERVHPPGGAVLDPRGRGKKPWCSRRAAPSLDLYTAATAEICPGGESQPRLAPALWNLAV
jgi:hypothetical protein